MKIDVSDLLKSLGAALKIDETETFDFKEDNLSLSSPVKVELKLTNAGGTVLVAGTLKTTVKLCCCRCLKEFDHPVSIKIEEEYSKRKPALRSGKAGEEIELKEKDFVFEISEDNIIDLDEAVRQNIIVNLPIKPVCNKACKLPEIVKDKGKKTDPRLAKLRSIKLTGGD